MTSKKRTHYAPSLNRSQRLSRKGLQPVFRSWFFCTANLVFLLNVANAQLIIQPMAISSTMGPGELSSTTLRLENPGQETIQVAAQTIDLAKDKAGQWITIDAGARDMPGLERGRSCRHWLSLETSENEGIDIGPKDTAHLSLGIKAPNATKGTYWAAVKFKMVSAKHAGVRIRYEFIVPVVIDLIDDRHEDAAQALEAAPTIQDLKPTASELLDLYEKTVNRYESFRVVAEGALEFGYNGKAERTETLVETFCWDEMTKRFSDRTLRVEQDPHSESTRKGVKSYTSKTMLGGELLRRCDIPDVNTEDPGYGGINTRDVQFDPDDKRSHCYAQAIMGYVLLDSEPAYTALRKANRLSVRPTMEKVGENLCYVIEAVTEYGPQLLWIDPDHGYSVAKAEVTRRLDAETRISSSLNVVKFKQVDGIWTPIEFETEFRTFFDSRNQVRFRKVNLKIAELSVNPDHEKLGSFDFEDIREGAEVTVTTKQGGTSPIKYIWRDGEAVPKE